MTNTKTIEISYEELEAALIPYLVSTGRLNDDEGVDYVLDMNIDLNENGLVEFDVIYADWNNFSNPSFSQEYDSMVEYDRQITHDTKDLNIWS